MELQIIKDRIITVRDQQVILNTDVAVLYGVETKHINQAIKNNPEKSQKDILSRYQKARKKRWSKNLTTLPN